MRWLALLVGTAAVAVVVVSAPVAAPPSETRYVAQLRAAAAQVDASYNELQALQADDPALAAAATRLQAAAAASCRTLRVYQNAKFRFGTAEEYRLVRALEQQLQAARGRYGSLTGVSLAGPTKTQLSTARQLFLAQVQAIAAAKVGRWVKDERLGEILTSGDLKQIRAALTKEVTRRINKAVSSFSQRALGISLSLDSPLKTQLRRQAEQAALGWLSRVAFHWDPTGVAIRIVGTPIIKFVRKELKELFRDHQHVTDRTNRTIKGFQSRSAELQKLLDTADNTRLAAVERSLVRAQHAIDATGYLKSDLRKQGRTELIARLTQAEGALLAKMQQVREDFLLDSDLASANLRQLADNACKAQGEIAKITKKAKTKPAPPSSSKAGSPPTAAVCVPKSIRIETFTFSGSKTGEYDASFSNLRKDSDYVATCIWVTPSGPPDEAFVVRIEYVPDGVQGALASGACGGTQDSPWYLSRKRYLGVSGGPRKYAQKAAAGDDTILKGVLAAAEAAGVGKACK